MGCVPPYEYLGGSCFSVMNGLAANQADSKALCENSGATLAKVDDCEVMGKLIDRFEELG